MTSITVPDQAVTGFRWWPRGSVILAWPALAIGAFFVVPFALLLGVSVAHRDTGGLWQSGFELTSFAAIFEPRVLNTLLYSAALAALVALICSAVAFPLAYFITRMSRRFQVVWLILLLSTMCLSEVLIAFAWQVMLAKRIGLSDVFVWAGLLKEPQSLSPGFGAVLSCLVYLVLPYAVLLLYPALSRLDRFVPEAAQTLGASPARAFFGVILPMMRGPMLSSAILVSVFTIGTLVTPSVLGRPDQWTIAVMIGRTALSEGNLPLAASLSIVLLIVTLGMTGATSLIGRRRAKHP